MGAQRALQAASVVALSLGGIALAKPQHERVAIIDLGPGDDSVRRDLGAKLAAAGLDPIADDGALDALAGQMPADGQLATLMAEAQRAYGALDCAAAVKTSTEITKVAAPRQAAGLPVPELARAWTYLLLCADKAGDSGAAMTAAARLRVLGGDLGADLAKKYPEVDAIAGGEHVPVEISADVPDAQIWIDYRLAGKAPLQTALSASEHVIVAIAGTRRGIASGTPLRTQPKIVLATVDASAKYDDVAKRVASWRGQMPTPAELGWVLGRVHARAALVRHGDTVEAWGRGGLAETPHALGGEDATGSLAEATRVIAVIVDRVATWNDHAPDPDKPLLVEDARARAAAANDNKRRDPPTKWWVYAAIGGSIVGGVALIYAVDSGTDRQRVELKFP